MKPARLVFSFDTKRSDLLLFAILLVPLVSYLAHNRSIFSVPTGAQFLAFFLAVPILLMLAARMLQRAH